VPTRHKVARLGRERNPNVGQHGRYFVGPLVAHASQGLGCDDPFSPRVEFGKAPFASAVNVPMVGGRCRGVRVL